MHIGLIGGIGPAATDFYYRGLIERHGRAGTRLELTMAHADVREMGENLAKGDARRQAETFAGLVQRLKSAGAEAAAVTSMGGHFCIRELAAIAPLPMIDGIPAVGAAVLARGYRKVGIIGTRMVMETRLYGAIATAEVVVPDGAQLDEVHQNYVAMANPGRVTDEQRRVFFTAGQYLCNVKGAEVVLLGGTDMFLAFTGQECGFPVLDCADIHAEQIYRYSIGQAA
jgi:aspartate racemase